MLIDYGGWNITIVTVLMMQTIFLSTFAWDFQDGGSAEGQKKNAKFIENMPSLLEFLSAGLCLTQSLAGPCSNFVDFSDYIWRRNDFAKIQRWSNVKACGWTVLTAFAWTGGYLIIAKLRMLERLSSPDDSIHNSGIVVKVGIIVEECLCRE